MDFEELKTLSSLGHCPIVIKVDETCHAVIWHGLAMPLEFSLIHTLRVMKHAAISAEYENMVLHNADKISEYFKDYDFYTVTSHNYQNFRSKLFDIIRQTEYSAEEIIEMHKKNKAVNG